MCTVIIHCDSKLASGRVSKGANASVKRVGQNRVGEQLVDGDGGSNLEMFVVDFGGPASSSNVFGAPSPANLTLGATIEAQYAGGDSGVFFWRGASLRHFPIRVPDRWLPVL